MTQQEAKSKGKREVTFTMKGARLFGYGLVVLGLMVWVFALGVLTGRGDVHRLFQRLGLYKTDLAARFGITPDGQTVAVLTPALPEDAQKAEGEAHKKAAPEANVAQATATPAPPAAKAPEQVVAKASGETSKKPGAAAATDAKKAKGTPPPKADPETNLAAKLSFLNSLDTPAKKPPKTTAKKEGAVHTASIAPAPSQPHTEAAAPEAKKPATAYQVRVGSFRTADEAEKALADLRKKGFNVNMQQGKDKSGTTYTIRTGRYTSKAEAEKVTQKLKEAKVNAQIQELKQ